MVAKHDSCHNADEAAQLSRDLKDAQQEASGLQHRLTLQTESRAALQSELESLTAEAQRLQWV